jgi:hypothetical protein
VLSIRTGRFENRLPILRSHQFAIDSNGDRFTRQCSTPLFNAASAGTGGNSQIATKAAATLFESLFGIKTGDNLLL